MKKVNEKLIEELCRYEDDFPEGVFAVPPSSDAPKVKVRALIVVLKETVLIN